MPEIAKAPRPWMKTLDLIALPLYVGNLIMGILLGDFAGGCIAGVMFAMLAFKLITALVDPHS